jgi:hypothetical protein
MEYVTTITQAIEYLRENDVEVPTDLALRVRRLAVKAAGDLSAINKVYHDAITASLISFFEGGTGWIAARNRFAQAAVDAFYDAFYKGWADGGGVGAPNGEAMDWLNSRYAQEKGHIENLFQQAKGLKKEAGFEFFEWVTARADGYTHTLRSIYNQGVLFAKGNQMLTFAGQDGDESHVCQSIGGTCVQLKGVRHRASWWIQHDMMPYPGNEKYDCGGWRCGHYLVDDNGKQVTL